jgi:hypothetical protein
MKFVRTIEQSYKRASQFNEVFPIISNFFLNATYSHIGEMAKESVLLILQYLSVPTTIIPSSTIFQNSDLSAQSRVIDICKKANASTYVNAAGGMELYSKDDFKNEGIKLEFLRSNPITYTQVNQKEHLPWLSIIDVIFNCDKKEVNGFLNQFQLI